VTERERYRQELERIAREHGCSLRTASQMLRRATLSQEIAARHAVEIAAHADWGNRTDIAPDIREIAELIKVHGIRSVSNSDRNKILRGLPLSLQINRD